MRPIWRARVGGGGARWKRDQGPAERPSGAASAHRRPALVRASLRWLLLAESPQMLSRMRREDDPMEHRHRETDGPRPRPRGGDLHQAADSSSLRPREWAEAEQRRDRRPWPPRGQAARRAERWSISRPPVLRPGGMDAQAGAANKSPLEPRSPMELRRRDVAATGAAGDPFGRAAAALRRSQQQGCEGVEADRKGTLWMRSDGAPGAELGLARQPVLWRRW